jgi:hypothetical protein
MKGPGSAETGIVGAHPIYRDAVTRAAEATGQIPNATQAQAWEGIQGLFSSAQRRNPMFKDAVDQVWKDYQRGRLTLPNAYDRIEELAGGMKRPAWANKPGPALRKK